MRIAAAVWLIALGACKLGGSFDDARFRCSDTSPCPAGRVCTAGYCEAAAAGDAAPPAAAVLGDVLTLTFDDAGLHSFRDRSGHRFDCAGGGSRVDAGVYGGAAYLEPSDFLAIPDQPELHLGNRLTIEAWLFRDAAGELDPVVGDRSLDAAQVAAEWALEVTAEDRLRLVSNDACVAGPGVSAESAADQPVPAGRWVHVAVAWDGGEARFYLDGAPAGAAPLVASPCELIRNLRIGRLQGVGDLTTMTGRIDELKVSSAAKSEADIRASMAFDSTALVPRCGDLIVEGEGCDGDSPCCDPAACAPAADGAPCLPGGADSCQAGVCQVAPGRPAGAVAVYELEEGSGTGLVDSSGVIPAIDLVIADAAAVSWGSGYLELEGDTIAESATSTSKIASRCAESGELTVEAWVQPALANQSGQVVALGDGTASEFGLAQYGMSWDGRVRSAGSSARGTPHVPSAVGDVAIAPTHLVLRREASGARTLFVDGRERGFNVAPGSLDAWGDHPLALGDEAGGGDPWHGRIYRVAIYCRALADLEVAASFLAGAEP